MSEFFKVTAEELEQAKTGGREKVELKDNEECNFVVEEVKEKSNDNGAYLIVALKFLDGEHEGKEYAIFVGESPNAKKVLLRLMTALFSREEILGGNLNPSYLVGKKFKTKAKLNTADSGKVYTNWLYFEELGGAPMLKAVGESEIPF
jgi:hypothetical protein